MSLEKMAAEAVSMLMGEGVDFDTATDLVLEKVAETGVGSMYLRGAAATERRIAHEHGHAAPKQGLWRDYKQNVKSNMRASLGPIATGLGVGAVVGGIGHAISGSITRNPQARAAAAIGSGVAAYLGTAFPLQHHNLKDQVAEMHHHYREKQAAVSMLMADGIDFDSAVDLVNSKSSELYGF